MSRKSVECNGVELIVAVLTECPSIQTSIELSDRLEQLKNKTSPTIIQCDDSVLVQYIDDCKRFNNKTMQNHITNFALTSSTTFGPIDRIVLAGKSFAKYPELVELNRGIDRKLAKADVFVQLTDGVWKGISVKQSADATKSNWSVHKFFPKEDERELNEIKLRLFTDNGFPEHKDENRPLVNKLLSDRTNPYFTNMRQKLTTHKSSILPKICEYLYPTLPYELYEYNGNALTKIEHKDVDVASIAFDEHEPFYMNKAGTKARKAAKMFYKLDILDKSYRVEIRFKGNCHGNTSPQFQLHEI